MMSSLSNIRLKFCSTCEAASSLHRSCMMLGFKGMIPTARVVCDYKRRRADLIDSSRVQRQERHSFEGMDCWLMNAPASFQRTERADHLCKCNLQ